MPVQRRLRNVAARLGKFLGRCGLLHAQFLNDPDPYGIHDASNCRDVHTMPPFVISFHNIIIYDYIIIRDYICQHGFRPFFSQRMIDSKNRKFEREKG
jgi:hypothetical protein